MAHLDGQAEIDRLDKVADALSGRDRELADAYRGEAKRLRAEIEKSIEPGHASVRYDPSVDPAKSLVTCPTCDGKGKVTKAKADVIGNAPKTAVGVTGGVMADLGKRSRGARLTSVPIAPQRKPWEAMSASEKAAVYDERARTAPTANEASELRSLASRLRNEAN